VNEYASAFWAYLGINTVMLFWLLGCILLFGGIPGRKDMADEVAEIWAGKSETVFLVVSGESATDASGMVRLVDLRATSASSRYRALEASDEHRSHAW
jgi:hypothetical protein